MSRRGLMRVLGTSFAVLSCIFSLGAPAQDPADNEPSTPGRFIIPYTPGSALDVLGRDFGNFFSERRGQPVVVDNRPGANQAIALEAGARAPADGYTWMMGTQSGLVYLTVTRKTLPYDPVKDFASVG